MGASAAAEAAIEDLVKLVRKLTSANFSNILITADHGGKGKVHGGETLAEMEIPFILHGPGVKPGYLIQAPVSTMDNAATLAWAQGLELPYVWIGKPVKEAFQGYSVPQPAYSPGKEMKSKE